MYKEQDYLVHYGVMGMKWGIRKNRSKSSSSAKTTKKESTKNSFADNVLLKDVAKSLKTMAKNVSTKRKGKVAIKKAKKTSRSLMKTPNKKLTNEQLQEKLNRLEMEKKIKDLQRAQMSEGAKIAKNILTKSVDNIGVQLGTYTLGTILNKLAGSDIVNPKKGQKDK